MPRLADEKAEQARRETERVLRAVLALPVVDAQSHVVGMLTAMDLGKLVGGRWLK